MLSLHKSTSNSSSTTKFPWLFPWLFVRLLLPLLFVTCDCFTYIAEERTRITGNTCHVTTTHRCVTSLRARKTASSIVACAYFGRDLQMTSFYCCVLEHVYRAEAWQWVFTLQYLLTVLAMPSDDGQ
jgi:hypothetical protein